MIYIKMMMVMMMMAVVDICAMSNSLKWEETKR